MLDKLLIAVVSPIGTALVCWLAAIVLCVTGRARGGQVMAAAAWLWLFTWSLPTTSLWLRGSMEQQFPYIAAERLPVSEAIVVLGGAVDAGESHRPPNLTGAADRLWFAAKIYKAGKAPLLLLSGGSVPPGRPEAEAMRLILLDLGVPETAMLLETESRNTRENASLGARRLRERGIHRVLLVTSALHMRRALRLFRAEGIEVEPAATDYEAGTRQVQYGWLPSADAAEGAGRAMKELLANWAGRY